MSCFRFVGCVLTCGLFLLPQLAFAQLTDAKILTVDGREITGTIQSIDEGGSVVGLGNVLSVADLLAIQLDRPMRKSDHRVSVLLVGGSVIGGDRVEIGDDQLTLVRSNQVKAFPLEVVRGVTWGKFGSTDEFLKSFAEPSKENDRVIVGVNDISQSRDGLLESVSSAGVGLNYQGKLRSIGMEKIRAIIMADLGIAAAKGPVATISANDGSQWVGVIKAMSYQQLTLSVTGKVDVVVDVGQINGIKIFSDRLKYLSDMIPIDQRESSAFTISRSFKMDRSVTGNPISLLGDNGKVSRFVKGIGVQATSELVFQNDNNFDRLQAVVGIDSETKGRGDCDVIIRGDGIDLWSRRIVGSAKSQSVDIDVTGIKQISLIVNAGREFDLADHLDWGDIRFLKTKD